MCTVPMALFLFVLFVLLAPGTLLRIPHKGGRWTVAVVHGVLFVLIVHFAGKLFL